MAASSSVGLLNVRLTDLHVHALINHLDDDNLWEVSVQRRRENQEIWKQLIIARDKDKGLLYAAHVPAWNP